MVRIDNVSVYGLKESLVRSGYAMAADVSGDYFQRKLAELSFEIPDIYDAPAVKRGKVLGNAPIGSGHPQYTVGVIVQFDLTAPQYFWPEFQRYHFADFITSQSKMHCLPVFDLKVKCIEGTDLRCIEILQEYIDIYKNDKTNNNFENCLKNCPMGLELTAGITTNYMTIRNMFTQRENHRLPGWNTSFVEFAHKLPMFDELCLGM